MGQTPLICSGFGRWNSSPARWETPADLLARAYEIEFAGERFAAQASLKPLYDPKSERVRGLGIFRTTARQRIDRHSREGGNPVFPPKRPSDWCHLDSRLRGNDDPIVNLPAA